MTGDGRETDAEGKVRAATHPDPDGVDAGSALSDVLKRWQHVNPEEIALLLSDDCLPKGTGRVATEFWAVPPAASLPSHERNIRLTDASITIIRGENHRTKVEEFIRQLRRKPDSYGFVKGSYFRNPSSTLRRRVRDAERQVLRHADLKTASQLVSHLTELFIPTMSNPKNLYL